MTLDQTVAGHRVLRLLATGDRGRLWLAADDRVLKVLPPDASAEILALHRAQGDHVIALLDVAVDDDQAVLVFPRLPRGSLAELLSAGAGLDAGEAVTALAPIADAVARMHVAGVAHGALSAANVLFRADGAPVLVGFGRAQTFEPGLPEVSRERLSAVAEDRAALVALCATVLGRVTGPRAVAAALLAQRLRSEPHTEIETRLGRDLFELAAARPVRFESAPDDAPPRRVVDIAQVAEPDPPAREPGRWAGRLVPLLESGLASVVRGALRDRWQQWSPRRRRLTAAGLAAGVALVVAVTAVPSPGPLTPTSSAVESPAPPDTDSNTSGEPTPSAVAADDPLAALDELLRLRTQCFRDLSVLCFEDVDQQGSAALADDRAALDAVVSDGAQPAAIDAEGATIVERLGDSALVALAPDSEPASVLLMKGEAGWRIRDYLASG